MTKFRSLLLLFTISFLFTNCKTATKKAIIIGETSQKAMVVSAREEASKIGLGILKKGGNAFDAMVATELALAVAYPYAGNIGGGGFMVYRKNDGQIGALDYREKAPLASSKDMYLDENGNVIAGKSTLGAMAVGVPGTVAGVFAAHKKFGTLSISEILQPVIDLAKKGIIVTKKQEARIKKYQPSFRKVNKDSIVLDSSWKENDTIKYPYSHQF
jgi:gamma-glutamyltranspeptidase/glutathione hydrolase